MDIELKIKELEARCAELDKETKLSEEAKIIDMAEEIYLDRISEVDMELTNFNLLAEDCFNASKAFNRATNRFYAIRDKSHG